MDKLTRLEKIVDDNANLMKERFNVFVDNPKIINLVKYLGKLSEEGCITSKKDRDKLKEIDYYEQRHIVGILANVEYIWQAEKIAACFMETQLSNTRYTCTKITIPFLNEFVAIVSILPPENTMIKD